VDKSILVNDITLIVLMLYPTVRDTATINEKSFSFMRNILEIERLTYRNRLRPYSLCLFVDKLVSDRGW